MITRRQLRRAALGLTIGSMTLLLNDAAPGPFGSFINGAEARIGRPATPLSYAGVARRTTRRAVAYGATAGAVAAGTYYYAAPGCRQVVNSYGQIVYRCP